MHRYFPLLILSVLVSLFTDCSNKPAPTETFGELDTTVIAADTSMQVNIDHSYEYQKTLVQNDTTVYDFLAYDRPQKGSNTIWESKFIVIKRTNTRQDTVIKDNRVGPVKGLCLADLDHDGRPEILFYEDQSIDKSLWRVRIFSPGPDGKYARVVWGDLDLKPTENHKAGDTLFVYQDHLIRRYPYYEVGDTLATGAFWQSYQLNKGKLVLENEKRVQ